MADEPELAEGARNEWVEYLQNWLKHLGYYDGEVDSWFGPKTADAVRAAQAAYQVDEGGQVSTGTWKILELARRENAEVTVQWGDADVNTVDVPEETADGQGAQA